MADIKTVDEQQSLCSTCSTTQAPEPCSPGIFVAGQCDACAPMFTSTPVTLAAWLHTTDRCNLRCDYCYLPHTHRDMSLATGYAAIDATFRAAQTYGYRQVKLKYAGGEPLLRFPLVVALQQYARMQASQQHITLDSVVLSNGTHLTSEMITTMQALKLRLMISLDGLGNAHDSQRPYANGDGSAADVMRSIELALCHHLTPDISVTVSGRNAHGLADLVRWLLHHDLPFSLNFYRENPASAAQADLQLEERAIIRGMRAAYQVIENNLPARSLRYGLIDRAHLAFPHQYPCSACHSYLVFDTAGNVACCPMQMQHPVGSIHDADLLALVRSGNRALQNPSVEEKEDCAHCSWKYICAGGCPLTTYAETGRYDTASPHCTIYQALYPEAMRLEERRLEAAPLTNEPQPLP